jgi:hypothetical protein
MSRVCEDNSGRRIWLSEILTAPIEAKDFRAPSYYLLCPLCLLWQTFRLSGAGRNYRDVCRMTAHPEPVEG